MKQTGHICLPKQGTKHLVFWNNERSIYLFFQKERKKEQNPFTFCCSNTCVAKRPHHSFSAISSLGFSPSIRLHKKKSTCHQQSPEKKLNTLQDYCSLDSLNIKLSLDRYWWGQILGCQGVCGGYT